MDFKPGIEGFPRVFSLGEVTLSRSKQLSEDLETLVPVLVRVLLAGIGVKLSSSLRKSRNICSCLGEASPCAQ